MMNCPFCAEEISDTAVECPSCFAREVKGTWKRKVSPSKQKSISPVSKWVRFTIRFTAAAYFLSAVMEILSPFSSVQLFGEPRGLAVSFLYHLIFTGLYLGMGLGLWTARSWGLRFVFWGTLLYTLDQSLSIVYGKAVTLIPDEFSMLLNESGKGMVSQMMAGTTLMTILFWWGFFAYLYIHRDYFKE